VSYSLARSGPTATYEPARSTDTDTVTPRRSCSASIASTFQSPSWARSGRPVWKPSRTTQVFRRAFAQRRKCVLIEESAEVPLKAGSYNPDIAVRNGGL
jgi:hypothetical protein